MLSRRYWRHVDHAKSSRLQQSSTTAPASGLLRVMRHSGELGPIGQWGSAPHSASGCSRGRTITSSAISLPFGGAVMAGSWSAAGVLERIVRLVVPPRTVSAEDRESFRDWYRESQRIFEKPAEEIDRQLAAAAFPPELPRHSALLVDTLGYLWAEEFRLAVDQRPATWNVFDPSGQWLGLVALPPQFEVHQIGTHFILGVRMGEVPVVESYWLRRGDEAPMLR